MCPAPRWSTATTLIADPRPSFTTLISDEPLPDHPVNTTADPSPSSFHDLTPTISNALFSNLSASLSASPSASNLSTSLSSSSPKQSPFPSPPSFSSSSPPTRTPPILQFVIRNRHTGEVLQPPKGTQLVVTDHTGRVLSGCRWRPIQVRRGSPGIKVIQGWA